MTEPTNSPLMAAVDKRLEEAREKWIGATVEADFIRSPRSTSKITVTCHVQEVRYSYGRIECYAVPVVGRGGCWIQDQSLRVLAPPA